MKKINKFISWIAGSFEGSDGRLSSKKASMFAFTFMFFYMVRLTGEVYKVQPSVIQVYPDIAWISAATGAGVIAAISVYQQLKNNDKLN